MLDFHEGRVFRPEAIVEEPPVEAVPVETVANVQNDIEQRAKNLAWESLSPEIKENFMQAALPMPAEQIPEETEVDKSFGGTVGAPPFIEDTEDLARRLILWSSAVAPLTHRRADGGAVSSKMADYRKADGGSVIKAALDVISKHRGK